MTLEPDHGLVLSNIRKRLGSFEVCANFTIAPGERAALVGRSGSGKTTLLRLIAGLDLLTRSDQGEIKLGDQVITELAPEKRAIGMVFQDQALFPALSVLENASFGLRMRGFAKAERDRLTLPWLEKIGLASHAHASVNQLSGGERQRVAFVRALVWKPKLLLLDEPFSALDTELRSLLRRELVELHQLWPVPLLMVTHDEADLEAVATVRLKLEESGDRSVRTFVRS